MRDASRIAVSGPLESFASSFASELSRQGYTGGSACAQLQLMAHVSRWLAEKDLNTHDLHAKEVERFLASRRAAGYRGYLSARAMDPMLCFLRELQVAPMPCAPAPQGPVEELLARFRCYLTGERGMASSSVNTYVFCVRPFVQGRLSVDGERVELEGLSSGDVTAFVVARCPRQSRAMAKLTVTALRSFLRFLHLDGAVARSLAAVVPSVARWRLAGLPKGLEPVEVRRLLAACDRRTHRGRRDFAILTTLSRLGLRVGEIAALRLDDIDWRSGELTVRGKGNRHERLPLPTDVGEALAAYLRRGRPASSLGRAVFLRHMAPHRALSRRGMTSLVSAVARRAGLGDIRPHRLRHTAATQMLRAGAALSEIGQVLRHRRAATTAIYAKVDREALRTIALPWPGGAQ